MALADTPGVAMAAPAIHRLFTHPARASVQLACDLIAAYEPRRFRTGHDIRKCSARGCGCPRDCHGAFRRSAGVSTRLISAPSALYAP